MPDGNCFATSTCVIHETDETSANLLNVIRGDLPAEGKG